ncbi:MAG: polyribonucleotide nucleotidyltransferase, partial [Nitrospira sp.]
MKHTVDIELAGRRLTLETGRIAKQADGAIWATYGDTVVLATAVASQNAKPGVDFLPLTVDYQEKTYAAGKIPGGYFKREGRPSEREVLTSRLIDRPLRPLFPEGYYFETQVITSVLSADKTGVSDVI